ncbi:MAG: hypothetical protein WBH77_00330, partial [Saccharofermentanales bacterium]
LFIRQFRQSDFLETDFQLMFQKSLISHLMKFHRILMPGKTEFRQFNGRMKIPGIFYCLEGHGLKT